MKIYIQFMVSLRCKMKVEEELEKLALDFKSIDLGVIELRNTIDDQQRLQLKENLAKSGLVLIEDKRSILIEKIKMVIVEMIHYSEEIPKLNYSVYISEKLGYDYTYLSNIFSEVKGITIQQFIIIHKIEKAKELILYDTMTLSEIADRLHYSSTSHLSHQFKKITGLAPSFYKQLQLSRFQNLENL